MTRSEHLLAIRSSCRYSARSRSSCTTSMVPCQFQLSGRNLDQAAEGYRQGRVAFRRTLSPRRLHRDEHEPPARARRCFLQQARDVRAMDQGRSASKCQGKWPDQTLDHRAARAAGSHPHTSRQSCCKAGKARIFTPVRESSGESRLMVVGGGGAIDVFLV